MGFEPPEFFNVADYFLGDRLREGKGERIALRLPGGERTYHQVAVHAHRFGHALRGLGVRQEERVFIALPDGEDFVGALFGVLGIGAVVVMINPTLGPDQLAELLTYCRPRAIVLDAGLVPAFEAARLASSWQGEMLAVGGEAPGATSFEPGRHLVPPPLSSCPTHRDDPAIWLFSGGTTGRPKAVVQPHRSFANTTELYAKAAMGYGPDDVTISVPKLYFGYATGSNLFFPFAVGGSAILFPEHPTAELLFELIRHHRPTVFVNVPTMVNQMVNHPAAAEADLGSLRFATSAGEALPVPLYRRWRELFGVELLDGLGTAEMWHVFLTNRPGDVHPGTLGKAVPGFEVRVRDDEGKDVADDEVGRLWVAGGSRALGYWRNLDRTEECFIGPFFVGGDLVQRDSQGVVTYCGRGDDMMKVSGRWVAPQEVESCLMRHPAVAECAVVAHTNDAGLTKPCAFVVPREPLADDEAAAVGLEEHLKSFALEQLAAYKHPRRVLFLTDFPRTHLGKVDRAKLKSLLD